MSQYGPGDGPPPKTKTVKVKAHTRKVRVKPAGPPNFPELIPVRPGALTPKGATEPSTQAQRTHVHLERVKRSRVTERAQAQHDVPTNQDMGRAQRYLAAHPEIIKPPKVKKASTGLFGTIDNVLTGKLTAGAVSAAEKAASTAAPYAAATLFPALTATAKVAGLGHEAKTLAENAGKDFVDIPANAIPSLYVPSKEVAHGRVGKAAKMLAQPFIDTAKHPVKSFVQHPIGTALLIRGGEGAIGHGAGRVLRAAPSETLRRVGSTERAAKTLPGTRVTQQRRYSKDVIEKGAQVFHERRQARRAVKHDTAPEPRMTVRDVRRRVDEDVQAAKIVAQQHAGQAHHEAKQAVGKNPTAATTLAAQGITTASHADLHAYLIELEHQALSLSGDELALNERAQEQIHAALKDHDEARVQQAAKAYSAHSQQQGQQVIAHGLLNPDVAEATRLAPIAVRRLGASAESKRAAVTRATDERKLARSAKVKTTRAATTARQGFARAKANARVSVARKGGVAPAEHDALLRAIAARDETRLARRDANTAFSQARTRRAVIKRAPFVNAAGDPITIPAIRAVMNGQGEPAFVSHSTKTGRTAALPVDRPSIPVKEQRTGEAVRKGTIDLHPDTLIEQSVHTQGLLDAADARNRFIEDFGYRAGKNVERYKTQKVAENIAATVKQQTGMDWTPMQHADGNYVLVPRAAKGRLAEHEARSTTHPMLKTVGAQWRRNVLAFSPRWLTGNTLEAALRSVVSGSGPRSYVTGRRSIRTLERTDPKAAGQLKARALSGGQYRTAQRIARDPVGEDLGAFAKAAARLRRTHGPKEIADAYGQYTKVVFSAINGRLETQFQTAMLGKALRDSPLMRDNTWKVSRQAAEDAAKGLKDTNAQVALGREVDRMYGQYSKYSPGVRAAISTYTPFIAWTLNAAKFLYVVLPHDHPVLTSLLASANQASEDWRKQQGLVADYFHAAVTPGWLQGSIPGRAGSHLRASRYTPFGLVTNEGNSPLGSLASMLLPQFSEIQANLAGKNWQGRSLTADGTPAGARDDVAAIASFLEGQVPAAAQVLNVAGVRSPNMADSTKIKPTVGVRARAQFDPFMYTAGSAPSQATAGPSIKIKPIKVTPVKVHPVRIKPIKVR